jgi:SecD/SecF fusion protein
MRAIFSILILGILCSCSSTNEQIQGELNLTLKVTDPSKKGEVHEILKKRLGYFTSKAQFSDDANDAIIKVRIQNENDTALFASLLTTVGKIQFLETFDNAKFFPYLEATNKSIEHKELEEFKVQDSARFAFLDSIGQPTVSLFEKLGANIDMKQQIRPGPYVGICNSSDTSLIRQLFKKDFVKEIFNAPLIVGWAKGPIEDYFYLVALKPSLKNSIGNSEITSVYSESDEYQENKYCLKILMTALGAIEFEKLTRNNIGKSIAIVIDNHVVSAPTVQMEIPNGSIQISGDFTENETKKLAAILSSSPLPTTLQIASLK